jgi:hypothetical protein
VIQDVLGHAPPGQEDAPAWLKVLERIGGLGAYPALLAPESTLAALRAWANSHGDDPLVGTVWAIPRRVR